MLRCFVRSLEDHARPARLGGHVPAPNRKSPSGRASADADSLCAHQYEFERRKYAQELIDFDKKFSALFSGKPRTEEHQDGISHEQFLECVRFPLVLTRRSHTPLQGLPHVRRLHIRHWDPLRAVCDCEHEEPGVGRKPHYRAAHSTAGLCALRGRKAVRGARPPACRYPVQAPALRRQYP